MSDTLIFSLASHTISRAGIQLGHTQSLGCHSQCTLPQPAPALGLCTVSKGSSARCWTWACDAE